MVKGVWTWQGWAVPSVIGISTEREGGIFRWAQKPFLDASGTGEEFFRNLCKGFVCGGWMDQGCLFGRPKVKIS